LSVEAKNRCFWLITSKLALREKPSFGVVHHKLSSQFVMFSWSLLLLAVIHLNHPVQ